MTPITADNLRHQHGFFTRMGGLSQGIYAGLNCGLGSGDDTDTVTKNRTLVAQWFNLPQNALTSLYQIHSPVVIDAANIKPNERPKADAMVSNRPDRAIGILTADCAPILFSDPDAGVVGAAHAGWRGALDGVISNTVDAMIELGASRNKITAAVGPCISQRNYEVGGEFFDRFMAHDNAFSRFFANGVDGKYQFDLPAFCLEQLRNAGLSDIMWCGHCTYDDAQRFYSYRRMCHMKQADYGRQISVIRAFVAD